MRVAAIADIHGNAAALEAVLADLAGESPDLVVNLGDHLSGPLEAARTAGLLMAHPEWVQIRGNHDRQILEGSRGPSDVAAASQIDDGVRGWLASLPAVAEVALAGVRLCHGTPSDDLTYLLESLGDVGPRLGSAAEIRARLGDWTGLVLCGHSHVPRCVRVDDQTTVVNPGSVGLQAYDDYGHRYPHFIEVGSPHARYAVLDRVGGAWRVTFRVVEYDWMSASRMAAEGGRRDWAHALATGYCGEGR